MTQQPLFCEDIYEALRTIGQYVGGPKKIGPMLWPDKTIDKSSQLWSDCTNRSRPEKLDPEQILFVLKIGRQAGCHVGAHFIAEQCGYRFEVVEPEDERAALMREFVNAKDDLSRILKGLEKFK